MNGPDCPIHKTPMAYGSTSNEYPFICMACNRRYNWKLESWNCILEVDSPSYPPTEDERRQCGCRMCIGPWKTGGK